jgi:hypothetical protein
MKKFIISLFVVFSLLLAPIAHATGFAGHSFAEVQPDKHIQLDFDSDDTTNHNHSHHHHGDYYPDSLGLYSATPITASQVVAFWNGNLYYDYSPSPLLEPPSHA